MVEKELLIMPILPGKLRLSIVLILLIGFVTGPSPSPALADGVYYYVAPDGDDENSGSERSPWLTLEYAAKEAGPGDTVLVRSGTYYPAGSILMSNNNPASTPTIFTPYPGEWVVIDGSRMPSDTDIFVIRGQYYEIRGFELRNARRMGINLYNGSHIRLEENVIHDSYKFAINGGSDTHHLYAIGNTIYRNCHENDSFQLDHKGGWPAAIFTTEYGDTIINNQIYENWGEGIGATGTNHLITGNILHDNYSIEIYADNLAESTISGNFIYTTNNPQFMRTYPNGVNASATGIAMSNENPTSAVQLNHLKVINNIVVGNRNWAISQWTGSGSGGLRNSIISNNTFVTDNVSGVLRMDDLYQENTTIANNIFYQRNPETIVALIYNIDGITFTNNHWYGEGRTFSSVGKSGANSNDNYSLPQLVNPAGNSPEDFRLVAGSPDIDAGASMNGIGTDFWKQARLMPLDIGAHETNPVPPRVFIPWIRH